MVLLCRGRAVVAIGGILTPEQVRQTAAAGASGVCVLRGLGSDPQLTVAALQRAFEQGRQDALSDAGQPVGVCLAIRQVASPHWPWWAVSLIWGVSVRITSNTLVTTHAS